MTTLTRSSTVAALAVMFLLVTGCTVSGAGGPGGSNGDTSVQESDVGAGSQADAQPAPAPPESGDELSLDGLWKSSGGTMVGFQQGVATASLFGFNGGPNGSYQLSRVKTDGTYELYGSHITGGTVDYIVAVQDADHITLTLQGSSSFAPKKLSLTRQ